MGGSIQKIKVGLSTAELINLEFFDKCKVISLKLSLTKPSIFVGF